jgi:hypothetical protein
MAIGVSVAVSIGALTAGAAFGNNYQPRSIATETPAQILRTTFAAMTAQKYVEAACHGAIAAAGISESIRTDVGPTFGTQNLTVNVHGVSGTGLGVERLVNGVAYFKGNAAFLQIQFNVKNSKWANQWISVRPGQRDYGEISSGLAMNSAVNQLRPGAPLTKSGLVHIAGQSAIIVSGSSTAQQAPGAGKAHLYVATKSPNLPIVETISSTVSKGIIFTGNCSVSKWGAKFTVSKPASSTPITKTNL